MTETTGLSPRQELVLKMIRDDGFNVPQVADALGITTQGVYAHIRRLRARGVLPQKGSAANGRRSDLEAPFAAVRATAEKQLAALERQKEQLHVRHGQIVAEGLAIEGDLARIDEAIDQLRSLAWTVAPEEAAA